MQRKIIFCLVLLILVILPFFYAGAQSHEANLQLLHLIDEAENSAVLLNNQQHTVPLTNLDQKKIVSVHFGFSHQQVFDSILNKYDFVDTLNAGIYADSANFYILEDGLKYFNTVVIALDNSLIENKKVLQFISDIDTRKKVIVAYFGNGEKLSELNRISAPILWNSHTSDMAASVASQIIFGGIAAKGVLPKTYSAQYRKGQGFTTQVTRLKFTVPEDVNINSNDLLAIDSIAATAIEQKATPGLVVLAAKDGKVFFNKAYGTHTYDDNIADKITDLFDMASVTKITATTPVVMRLYDEGKLNLDTTIGYYLARARTAAMNHIHVREVMLHQAGFVPFIPFYKELGTGDFSRDSSAAYPTKVADHFYIRKNYFRDVMWTQMLAAPIKTRGKYVYSDISMYTMQQIVEQITGTPLNIFVLDTFYKPLGMQTAGYLPRKRFDISKIVPTENDTSFRHQLIMGYVHDEGAALKGGVAGHAGLFASSIDLAIYYQMLLNNGSYGGVQYFKPQTVTYFTGKRSDVSRRGLGFDRADTAEHYPSTLASPETFGHTGFTGIGVWVDKPRNLVYIFLSNRVNPDRSGEIYKLSTRSKMEDVFNRAVDRSVRR